MTISHPPGGRLALLSAGPAVTFLAAEHHRPLALAGTKLYCLVTEAHSKATGNSRPGIPRNSVPLKFPAEILGDFEEQ